MQLELVDPFSPRVEQVWRALEATARPSYFLTWGWMENWLASLPRREAPRLAVLTDGDPIGACFLARKPQLRHGFVPSRALHLNTTGDTGYDELCIEHNALLAPVGAMASALGKLVELLPMAWDELFLPACDPGSLDAIQLPSHCALKIDREVACFTIDLARVRATKGGYVALLGSSTRAQIRKAQRAAGELTVEIASDSEHAFDIYEEMVALHQKTWRSRGEPGAWADPWFDRFHRRLIQKRLPHGEIQLVRVKTGEGTLGCLYNLVANGRVLFYQSGFGTHSDRHVRPGYVCHGQIIEHCAKLGLDVYDLLGGDARYKSNLGIDEGRIVWARIQKKRVQFAVEGHARTIYHRLRALRRRPEP